MARRNQCSQCPNRAKLCTMCKTYLCFDHYMHHSCVTDRTVLKPEDAVDDEADRTQQELERMDARRQAEKDYDDRH